MSELLAKDRLVSGRLNNEGGGVDLENGSIPIRKNVVTGDMYMNTADIDTRFLTNDGLSLLIKRLKTELIGDEDNDVQLFDPQKVIISPFVSTIQYYSNSCTIWISTNDTRSGNIKNGTDLGVLTYNDIIDICKKTGLSESLNECYLMNDIFIQDNDKFIRDNTNKNESTVGRNVYFYSDKWSTGAWVFSKEPLKILFDNKGIIMKLQINNPSYPLGYLYYKTDLGIICIESNIE